MNRIMRTIARLLTPWRTIRQLEREVKRLKGVIANPYLAGLQIGRDAGIEVGFRGSGPQLLAGMFAGLLEDGASAPNYLDLEFQTQHRERILVHVQRLHGETPHALRVKAEHRADAWQDIAMQLVAAAEPALEIWSWAPIELSHKGALNAAILRTLARKAYEPMHSTDGPAVPQGREPDSVNGTLPQHRAGAQAPVHIEPLHFVGSDPANQPLQIADAVEPDTSGSTG
jgi:hypothetical protein